MLSQEEQSRLASFREMATMNQGQALEYHELLVKEMAVVEATKTVAQEAPLYEVIVEAPKKRGKRK